MQRSVFCEASACPLKNWKNGWTRYRRIVRICFTAIGAPKVCWSAEAWPEWVIPAPVWLQGSVITGENSLTEIRGKLRIRTYAAVWDEGKALAFLQQNPEQLRTDQRDN